MSVRPPAVAGLFYPGDPGKLAAAVDELLRHAGEVPKTGGRVKAIVAPHAGYVYSGPVAAAAYATVLPFASEITRVVLLGPAHRVAFTGVACPTVDALRTPLGDIAIDNETTERLRSVRGVVFDDRPHADEHSIEVHLPFLQRLLHEFTIVPLVVGRADTSVVSAVLEAAWGGDETLIVVSSDLSHYETYQVAAAHDRNTAAAIVAGSVAALGPLDACGIAPIRGLVSSAATHRLSPTLLELQSSGDTAGSLDRVVGYGAFAYTARSAS